MGVATGCGLRRYNSYVLLIIRYVKLLACMKKLADSVLTFAEKPKLLHGVRRCQAQVGS